MRCLGSLLILVELALSGCGAGLKVDSRFEKGIQQNSVYSNDLLQAPAMDLDSTAPPVFDPILSQANYDAVLQLNDLSYAVVNEYGFTQGQVSPTSDQIGPIRSRIQSITNALLGQGWSRYQSISGRTGRNNVDPDITAIVQENQAQRLIVAAFHGSRSGNRNPHNHDGHGDWGSNHDKEPVAPSTVGLPEFPDHIRIHRGFGNNLASAREALFLEIDRRIDAMGPGRPIWVWTTGHSKGGGMGGLAAGLIKAHINAHINAQGARYAHVKVGGILFSSPRVIQGDQSQEWFHNLLGRTNLFRINVNGDPVTVSPGRSTEGYRSLGVLFLDSIWAVNLRTRQTYGTHAFGWANLDEVANYHYGCGLRGLGYEFDPSVVMRHSELASGFEEGRFHLRNRR